MKSSYAGLGVVVLGLAGLWYAGGGTTPLPPSASAAEQVRVAEPLAHENLTVFFVHGPDAVSNAKVATLQEALEAGWAVVHETESVNQLSVENKSAEYELFIQEGDIIKGGKQDRMIAVDMLLPPKSGVVPFPAHCVEQGRWTGRGGEAATHFQKSTKCAVGNDIKLANAYGQQGEVWKNVKENQEKISAKVGVKINGAESESSFQLALENGTLQAKVADYEQALRAAGETRKNVIGVVFVVNGKVTGAEVYGSNAIFQKAWPKLLNSAATEALAEKTDKTLPPAPSAKEVERYLACADREEPPARGTESDVPQLRDGTTNAAAFSGVSDTTRTRLLAGGGGRGDLYRPVTSANLGPNPTPTSGNRTLISGGVAGVAVQTEGQPVQLAGAQPQPAPNRNPDANNEVQDLLEVLRPLNRTAAQPANPTGNRLNVNRVDNASALVTESRDPARQNAVIHKSYIKK